MLQQNAHELEIIFGTPRHQWKTGEFPCHVNVHFLVPAILQVNFEYNFITAILTKTEADNDNFEPLQKIRATNLFESLIRKSHTLAICMLKQSTSSSSSPSFYGTVNPPAPISAYNLFFSMINI
jgi:hypothetical protein